jgi:hypothetical protein
MVELGKTWRRETLRHLRAENLGSKIMPEKLMILARGLVTSI